MTTATQSHFKLSESIRLLRQKSEPDGLTVEQIILNFGERGHSLLICLLTLPFLQPLPMMGLSTAVGGSIGLIGFWLMVGQKPWLPAKLLHKQLSAKIITAACDVGYKILSFLEKFIKPRGKLFNRFPGVVRFNGLLILINAFLLALPLPIPFTNSIPAWSILFLALGSVEEDAYTTLLGYLASALCFTFFALLLVAPVVLIQYLPGFSH